MLPGVLDQALIAGGAASDDWTAVLRRSEARAVELYNGLAIAQRAPVVDPNPWVSALCPRRSGKSYMVSSAALITGEANPGSMCVVISLTLKTLKRNYWLGSRSGLPFLSKKYGLNIEFNSSELRWEHENGSMGYLLGAEDRNQMEYIRGMEGDLYIVDECKSFPASVLDELITDILMPQRISRMGRIMMIGTPGSVFAGPFYQATCPAAVQNEEGHRDYGRPFLVPWGQDDPWERPRRKLWSYHHWSLQDNEHMPHQWQEALDLKDLKGWGDDHPTWKREYLGHWIATADGLVYSYTGHKDNPLPGPGEVGKTTWRPVQTAENPTGLPIDGGPWHLVMGLDVGFNDPTALVVAAWSESHPELREVHSEKHAHLLIDDIVELIQRNIDRFGRPETISVDTGGSLAKNFAETLIQRYGLPVLPAKKVEKNDYIELLNSDFQMGRVKIIPNSELEEQLLSVQWDLSKAGREELAHRGKLREDPSCPNDVTDAFLYMWRECHHHFARKNDPGPEPGTLEWWQEREKLALARARAEVSADIRARDSGRSNILTRDNIPFGGAVRPIAVPWRLRSGDS